MDEKQFQPPYYYNEEDDGISMLDILIILAERKKMILAVTLIFLLGGLASGFFFTKPEYVSSVQLMPLTASVAEKDSYNVFIAGNTVSAVASSTSTFDQVIDKFGLLKRDGKVITRVKARKELGKHVGINGNPNTGVVTIYVKDKSPELAANMANYIYTITLSKLKDMAIVASVENNTANIEQEIDKYIKNGENKAGDAKPIETIGRLAEFYTLLNQYDESKKLKYKMPVVVQLISTATVPDEKEPQGRGKITVLSAILGLFVGITLAFVCNFWQTAENDPETKEKKARLCALLGRKSA